MIPKILFTKLILVRYMCPAGALNDGDFPPACLERGKWTPWFDHNNPMSDRGFDDIETIRDLHKVRPHELCDEPVYMQAQTVNGIPAGETGDVFEVFDPRRGLICRGIHQESGECQDYRVRFFCPTDTVKNKVFHQFAEITEDGYDLDNYSWTSWYSADEPNSIDSTGDFEYLTVIFLILSTDIYFINI